MPSLEIHNFITNWTFFKVLALVYITGLAQPTSAALPPIFLSPTKTEVVKYVNETHIVSCQSERGVHIMWTRPSGEQITQTKGRIHVEDRWKVRGVNLIFENIEKKDRGNYTCTATVDGKELRHSFKLVVIKQISFMDTPIVQNASEHQDMLIRCEVDGDPEPKVAWQVKGKPPQSPKHKIMADGLYIKNVTLADRGDYLCRAFQASPIASNIAEQNIALRVHHKPQWPTEQSVRDRAYGFVSGSVNLSCEAVAEPEPDFVWIKNNSTIGTRDSHAHLYREPHRSVLQLSVHNNSVFGEYVCRASNSLGSLERVVVLHEGARPATPRTSVRAATPNSLTLELTAPEPDVTPQGQVPLEVSGFRVQVKQKEANDWDNAQVFDFNTDSGLQYVVKDLEADSVYTLRVAARNAAGLGEFGAEQNYRTARLAAAATSTDYASRATSLRAATYAILIALLAC